VRCERWRRRRWRKLRSQHRRRKQAPARARTGEGSCSSPPRSRAATWATSPRYRNWSTSCRCDRTPTTPSTASGALTRGLGSGPRLGPRAQDTRNRPDHDERHVETSVYTTTEFFHRLALRRQLPRDASRFHFKVSNCKAGQRALFSIVNFSKSRSLFRDGMSPLVRPNPAPHSAGLGVVPDLWRPLRQVCSSSRPTWERIPPKNCFYYRSPKANNGCVPRACASLAP
jgi:hypothetical protein